MFIHKSAKFRVIQSRLTTHENELKMHNKFIIFVLSSYDPTNEMLSFKILAYQIIWICEIGVTWKVLCYSVDCLGLLGCGLFFVNQTIRMVLPVCGRSVKSAWPAASSWGRLGISIIFSGIFLSNFYAGLSTIFLFEFNDSMNSGQALNNCIVVVVYISGNDNNSHNCILLSFEIPMYLSFCRRFKHTVSR